VSRRLALVVVAACGGPPQLQLLPDAPQPDAPATVTTVTVHTETGHVVRNAVVAFIPPGESELRGEVRVDIQGRVRVEAPDGSTIVATIEPREGEPRTIVHAVFDVPAGASIRLGPELHPTTPPAGNPTEEFVTVEVPPFMDLRPSFPQVLDPACTRGGQFVPNNFLAVRYRMLDTPCSGVSQSRVIFVTDPELGERVAFLTASIEVTGPTTIALPDTWEPGVTTALELIGMPPGAQIINPVPVKIAFGELKYEDVMSCSAALAKCTALTPTTASPWHTSIVLGGMPGPVERVATFEVTAAGQTGTLDVARLPFIESVTYAGSTATATWEGPASFDVVGVHLRHTTRPFEWFLHGRGTARELVRPPAPGVTVAPGELVVPQAMWMLRSAELAAHPFDVLLPGPWTDFLEPRPDDLAVSSLEL
jgi:hypothetical protein